LRDVPALVEEDRAEFLAAVSKPWITRNRLASDFMNAKTFPKNRPLTVFNSSAYVDLQQQSPAVGDPQRFSFLRSSFPIW